MRPEIGLKELFVGEPSSRDRLLLRALACGLLVLAVLRPPETYPWSAAVAGLLLVAATGLIWLRAEGEISILPRFTAGLLPFVMATVLLSSCRARALDAMGGILTLILAVVLGRGLSRDEAGCFTVLRVLVVLGAVAALLAILQHHITYREELRGLLEDSNTPSAYVVARLRTGRPSGPFSLPAALGGFFALTLPLTLVWFRKSRDPWPRRAAIGAGLLQSYALILTGSIGGLLATAVSVSLSLPAIAPRARRTLIPAIALLVLAIVVWVAHQRRAEILAPGGHPLALRAGNWGAAAEMIRDHPLFGVGPGAFGTFYPRYLRPGMNETRYAHDSYLQAIAEWGAWAILPIGCFLAAFITRFRSAWRRCSPELPFAAAGAAFLIHNLVDFTAYLPGVAIPAAILIGLALGVAPSRMSSPVPAVTRREAAVPWRAALMILGLVVFLSHAVLTSRAESLLERARTAATEGSYAEALDLARRAAGTRPDDPVPRGFIAEWVLRHGMEDGSLRREGERQVLRAVRLDPESAVLHHDLSLFLLAAKEPGPAFRELFAAHRLYPLKEDYRPPEDPQITRDDP